jgi:hypothetical protein
MAVGMLLAGEGVTQESYRQLTEAMFGNYPMREDQSPDGLIVHTAGQGIRAGMSTTSGSRGSSSSVSLRSSSALRSKRRGRAAVHGPSRSSSRSRRW